ncbi:MAG TPA: GAF domain-containing protein [Candidatus Sulfomarinibacteraceae bacterium]|nr:GAF domain-containing protein [Candidatus Sulfomarinibacteraceae bacterium]
MKGALEGQDRSAQRGRRRWWSLSHRSKIVAWAFIPAALILGSVALVAFFGYRQVMADMVMERDRQLVQLAAMQLAGDLDERASPLGQAARALAVAGESEGAQQAALRAATQGLTGFGGGLGFVNPRGTVVATQPHRPVLLGQDWSDLPFFREVQSRGQMVYSDLLVASDSGASMYSVAVAVPVIGPDGEFRGALVGFHQLDEPGGGLFAESVASLPLHAGRQIYVVDGQGRLLYHAQAARIGADYGDVPSVRSVLARQAGALRTVDGAGEAVVTAYAPIPGTRWGLVGEDSWSALVAPYRGYQNLLLLLLVLGLVAPAVVVMVGVRRLMRPLETLRAATQEVARGNFGRTVRVESGDEIEALARHFNLMSAELAASYARLEERLAARTRELAALTAIAAEISHAEELQAVLHTALGEALDVMGMKAGGVYLLDESQERLALAAHEGLDGSLAAAIDDLAPGEGFSGRVVVQGEPVLAPDLAQDPRLTRPEARESGFHALASFPLRAGGQVLGALFVLAPEIRTFSPEDVELLTSIGQQMGVAVENARLLQRAQDAAAHEERQRLARELHDAVTQTLFSATLIADVLPRVWEKDPALGRARLVELSELSRAALAEMRMLLLELRPAALAEGALPDLLRQLVAAVRGRSRLQIALEVDGAPPEEGLPPDVQIALYRITQETLNNVVKHAEAQRVSVTLAFGEAGVLLDVADDGVGFDPGADGIAGHGNSFGLSIMRERAAQIGADLEIESAPGAGTRVTVVAPLPPDV